jgi:multidrug efflux pump subunit AcrA (membrane-fusion protein)
MKHRPNRCVPRRRGAGWIPLIVLLAIATALGLVAYRYWPQKAEADSDEPVLQTVAQGPYEHVVLEQGEIESATNVEIRCEVKGRGTSGTTILSLVPEGAIVKAGDVLAKLDSTQLEQEKITQQIAVNSSHALVVQAENTFEAAKISKIEYLEGTFKQEEKLILGEVFVAEQNLRTAELAFESARRLAAKNIVTSLQLEGSQFAIDKARNELEAAQGKLDVLRKYTKEKMLKTLDSDIAIADAKLNSEKSSHQLEVEKLRQLEEQIQKCTLIAPADGQVVYVNKYSSGRSSTAEFVVEAGAMVREQQPVFRLPDAQNMQVKALINEARITLVRVGMPVAIRVDALKDEILEGEVTKVNQYAEPQGWGSTVKKYAAFVRIKNPPPEIRVGMNAEVRIYVERRSDATTIPVQALVEQKGHFFALVRGPGGYETREVKVGSTNDKVAVIESGLQPNDQVAMNPRGQAHRLQLPEIPDPAPTAIADVPKATTPVSLPQQSESVPATKEGGPRKGGGGPGGLANMSPAQLVARTMTEFDKDTDGKLSAEEIGAMDERRRGRTLEADTNKDGFVDRAELTTSTQAFMQRMRERMQAGEGGGSGGGFPVGGQ